MEFNKQKFALASAITMTVTYVICTVYVALLPETAVKFGGWILHLVDVDKFIVAKVTLGGFVMGLLPILFYSYIGAYLFAWLYNRLTVQKN